MALVLYAGLLAFVFWRSEQWMYQHVFKVGWLLSRNNNTTVIFYYAAFLPGVLLHELVKWLAAGICNVRATRSVQLPQQDEIDELQLGFVRIAAGVHPFKRFIIELVPLVVALLVLWHIAVNVLNLGSTWAIAAAASLDDIALAISHLTATADFWLWFYLAFTIANTMMPAFPSALKGRGKLTLAIVTMILVTIGLGLGDMRTSELTLTLESLLQSLTMVLLAITLCNLVMVLILGSIEALIERITGHSATFVGGKLTTVTRQEARRIRESGKRRRPQKPAAASPVAPSKSIYALPLPIPGPPGIEPVSRNIAAILDLRSAKDMPAVDHYDSAIGGGEPNVIDSEAAPSRSRAKDQPFDNLPPARPTLSTAAYSNDDDIGASGLIDSPSESEHDLEYHTSGGEQAPFSRPFVGEEFDLVDDDETIEVNQLDAGYSRPFALPSEVDVTTENIAGDNPEVSVKSGSATRTRATGKTKPVPKPSRKPAAEREHGANTHEDGELRYEPLDDDDVYDDDAFADDSS